MSVTNYSTNATFDKETADVHYNLDIYYLENQIWNKKKKVKGVVCFWLSFIVIESRDREESGHGRQKKGINRFIKMLPIPPPPSELPNTNANSLLHYYID